VKKAEVQHITPHDLRHTCARLAVSAGVNVLALQRMLGHKSAKATLDTYSDLFDDDLDAVAVTLHSRYSRSSVGKVWARAVAGDLPQSGESGSTSENAVEMSISEECGRRDSNPHALSSTGT
jgi:Phage integrase family